MRYAIIQLDGTPEICYLPENQGMLADLFQAADQNTPERILTFVDRNIVLSFLHDRNRIGAIKHVRQSTGMLLRDAKDWLDRHYPKEMF
jgi:ribosomal protein L7/L12